MVLKLCITVLRVRECQVLLLFGKTKGCFFPPPYLDMYGETDQGLRRGNPLHLNVERYRRLQTIWLQHSVPQEIAHSLESNSSLLSIDWQHLQHIAVSLLSLPTFVANKGDQTRQPELYNSVKKNVIKLLDQSRFKHANCKCSLTARTHCFLAVHQFYTVLLIVCVNVVVLTSVSAEGQTTQKGELDKNFCTQDHMIKVD